MNIQEDGRHSIQRFLSLPGSVKSNLTCLCVVFPPSFPSAVFLNSLDGTLHSKDTFKLLYTDKQL